MEHNTKVNDTYPMKRFPLSHILTSLSLFLFAGVTLSSPVSASHAFPDKTTTLWHPYVEWQIDNVSYSGNPFDVISNVTFTHTASGEKRTTQMFYDGGETFKFRFTGTRTGEWTFATSSSNSGLNGHTGKVQVGNQTNPNIKGFVSHHFTDNSNGSKWTRSNGEAFVPQFVMYGGPQYINNNLNLVDKHLQEFIDGHGFNGINVPVFCRWHDIRYDRCSSVNSNTTNPNPDLVTFEALEVVINKTYAKGGVVHLWKWGDNDRNQNPDKYWGLNSTPDRRLQRYIAARLGPLPGWTIGYGFDLWEWSTGSQHASWHKYMHDHMGWDHYLGARWEKQKLTQSTEVLDYSGYEWHKPSYQNYIDHISERPGKPAFSEDRFRMRDGGQSKDYNADETRRGLYHSTMAGGVANIWGNLIGSYDGTCSGSNLGTSTSCPYPNKNELKTYSVFFFDMKRFLPSMIRDNSLTNGYALKTPDNKNFVLYRESTNSISFTAPSAAVGLPVIAVNAKNAYSEINLGTVQSGTNTFSLPASSDWALAIGTFDGTIPTPTPTPTPGPSPTPVPGAIVTNLTVASNNSYSIQTNLQVGDLAYTDRSFTYSSLPSYLLGGNYIRTANDDKSVSGDFFMSFTLLEEGTVYIAHDDRITTKPQWLSTFTNTQDKAVSGGGTFTLYSRDYPKGEVVLGGNEGGGNSMYTVIVIPKGDSSIPGDANGDGKVDGLDYVIWLNNYGRTDADGPQHGDFNSDARVDGLDYVIWLNNYGT